MLPEVRSQDTANSAHQPFTDQDWEHPVSVLEVFGQVSDMVYTVPPLTLLPTLPLQRVQIVFDRVESVVVC